MAKAHVAPFLNLDALNFFALILCLMIGTASLPHILMRYFTTPTVRDARKSVAWSLFFIFLLYFTAPAYAAFAKLEIYQNVIGQTIAALPVWVGELGHGRPGLDLRRGGCRLHDSQLRAQQRADQRQRRRHPAARRVCDCIPMQSFWRLPRSPACPT